MNKGKTGVIPPKGTCWAFLQLPRAGGLKGKSICTCPGQEEQNEEMEQGLQGLAGLEGEDAAARALCPGLGAVCTATTKLQLREVHKQLPREKPGKGMCVCQVFAHRNSSEHTRNHLPPKGVGN